MKLLSDGRMPSQEYRTHEAFSDIRTVQEEAARKLTAGNLSSADLKKLAQAIWILASGAEAAEAIERAKR